MVIYVMVSIALEKVTRKVRAIVGSTVGSVGERVVKKARIKAEAVGERKLRVTWRTKRRVELEERCRSVDGKVQRRH